MSKHAATPATDAVHRDRSEVYDDGAFHTCPDCGGDLQYHNATDVVCLVCSAEFAHFYTPDGQNELQRAWTTSVVTTVYDPFRDDRERTGEVLEARDD